VRYFLTLALGCGERLFSIAVELLVFAGFGYLLHNFDRLLKRNSVESFAIYINISLFVALVHTISVFLITGPHV
jgi:hypothetical protein